MSEQASIFDTVYDRTETDSQKWQKYEGKDILPMWVADMDFHAPEVVLDALHERIDHGIFGYARPEPSCTEAVIEMLEREYGWKVEAEWLVWLPGLVVGLNVASRAFCQPNESVLTTTPIYPPFIFAPKFQKRAVVKAPMGLDGDRYVIDWDALEAAITPDTKVFFFCNPHNPCARVFERQELEKVVEFCERHDLLCCSDEIHCELLLDGRKHIPLATVSEKAAERIFTFIAPSKTYNLAGLGCSIAIIPDKELRQRFTMAARGIVAEVNNLGYTACEAAYRYAGDWRDQLQRYLAGNRDFIHDFVKREIPDIGLYQHEATYLSWMDVSRLELSDPVGHFESHGIGLSDGAFFDSKKHVRLNFGCPRSTLEEGLRRLKAGVDALK
ncbi:PatB family C-S lyase [Pelagicoccus sp. SDUM812003]|uniref:MalY/PatB family protein n=1 Tax=Pelagicoccus sp. SDUM812003 TaxID=3041267 RepID=UPI00280EA4C6|nr:PatB family C-S lyase [Pelagicoccus sp. SDUM812003]MDQ8202748.1 PatB family C-S lyase [Pelagicoccus sp. SDUM812003]